ncbi:hypothetical protein ES703_67737 [subsurface metagenome]
MERTVWGYRADFTVDRRRIRSFLITLLICVTVLACLSPSRPYIPWARGIDIDDIFGNFTLVNKPVPAVPISSGEIPIGNASTYSYSLQGGRRYHIYLTGEWANPTTHLTDYDIHVYKINGVNPVLTSTRGCSSASGARRGRWSGSGWGGWRPGWRLSGPMWAGAGTGRGG